MLNWDICTYNLSRLLLHTKSLLYTLYTLHIYLMKYRWESIISSMQSVSSCLFLATLTHSKWWWGLINSIWFILILIQNYHDCSWEKIRTNCYTFFIQHYYLSVYRPGQHTIGWRGWVAFRIIPEEYSVGTRLL